jgi:hypothetical protein
MAPLCVHRKWAFVVCARTFGFFPVICLNGAAWWGKEWKMRVWMPACSLLLGLFVGLSSACGSGESTTNDPGGPTCTQLVTDDSLALEAPPDGAAACGAGDCNYQTQAGCPDDQACRPQFNATVTPSRRATTADFSGSYET